MALPRQCHEQGKLLRLPRSAAVSNRADVSPPTAHPLTAPTAVAVPPADLAARLRLVGDGGVPEPLRPLVFGGHGDAKQPVRRWPLPQRLVGASRCRRNALHLLLRHRPFLPAGSTVRAATAAPHAAAAALTAATTALTPPALTARPVAPTSDSLTAATTGILAAAVATLPHPSTTTLATN